MLQWGDKWIFGAKGEPMKVLDSKTKAPVQSIGVVSRDGHFLEPQHVTYKPGPGLETSK